MKHDDIIPGREAIVRVADDLELDGELFELTDQRVTIIKLTTGGMALVSWQGRLYMVPPRNLEEVT